MKPLILCFLNCLLTLNVFSSVNLLHAEQPPNIVMIISDDQAWTDYSFMGHEIIETPNLDELARQSVVFKRGYVPTALCRPSLMTMITGRYAHQHGVTGNDPSPKYARPGTEQNRNQRKELIAKIDQWQTLPKQLSKLGYACHQSGKWWEGSYQRGGFTHGMTRGFPEPGGRHGDAGLKIGRQGIRPVTEFIDQSIAQKKPFFVWYAPFLPHTPHTPPQRLATKYAAPDRPASINKYYAMCEWFDESCGQLLNHLTQSGVRDNTVIVYVCDNGWIQDPNGKRYAPRSKQTPFEGGVRTPILFSWPKNFPASSRDELCSSVDLAPTILSIAGAEIPADLPGVDLAPHLRSGMPIERDIIFGESFAHDIADIHNPEKSLLFQWCISGKWKLILTYDGEVNRYRSTHPRKDPRPQLFDLSSDASEKQNLAKTNPELVRELAKKIEQWHPLKERKTVTHW